MCFYDVLEKRFVLLLLCLISINTVAWAGVPLKMEFNNRTNQSPNISYQLISPSNNGADKDLIFEDGKRIFFNLKEVGEWTLNVLCYTVTNNHEKQIKSIIPHTKFKITGEELEIYVKISLVEQSRVQLVDIIPTPPDLMEVNVVRLYPVGAKSFSTKDDYTVSHYMGTASVYSFFCEIDLLP